jgi:hypothetical protein
MQFKPNPLTTRAEALLRRHSSHGIAASPSVLDLTILVLTLVISVFVVSVIYDSGLKSQIAESREQLRALREQDATVQELLAEQRVARHLYDVEQDVPHPKLTDRDVQSIGTHIDVSWEPPVEAPGRYISYEVELTNLDGGKACQDQPGPTCVFLASDSQNSTSRIPAQGPLDAGRYVWRVAAVPTGTSLSPEPALNERALLTEWSSFASFTLYGQQSDRIWTTRKVRVGLDLNQGTVFASRSSDGTAKGREVSMIFTLIEGCLEFRVDHKLHYSKSRCTAYISSHRHPLVITSRTHNCAPNDDHPCVELVPIDKWGSYPSAVKRKEVDLFLGTATRAAMKERSGLRFTRGYFAIHTEIYGHAQDVGEPPVNLSKWLERDRDIGAITGSTNSFVLDDLLKEVSSSSKRNKPSLRKVEFDSFPSMEAAMDKGELDGLIIDDAFVQRPDWAKLSGLTGTNAWSSYLSNYICGDREEYATAVAVDDRDQSLYAAVEEALKDGVVTRDNLALFAD